jgi:integrase
VELERGWPTRDRNHERQQSFRSQAVKALQRLLGHASASMTLDVYSALFDSDLDAVAERLGQRR